MDSLTSSKKRKAYKRTDALVVKRYRKSEITFSKNTLK